MLIFDFVDDKGLSNILNRLIGCMLPHSKYDKSFYRDIHSSITRLIKTEEMDIPHSLLVETLGKLGNLIVISDSYEPKLYEKDFEGILSSGLIDYIDRNRSRVSEWMAEQGEPVNLDIREHFDRSAQYIFSKSMELYSECYSTEEDSSNYPILVMTLREEFKSNVIAETHRVLSKILVEGCWIGRKKYSGYDDYLNVGIEMSSEIQLRLEEEEKDDVYTIDDPIKTRELMQENEVASQVIANWDIPELDDFTPILRRRLTVICAAENVGKTFYACHTVAHLILEGKKVLFMCGESHKSEVYNKVVSSYIGKKFDMCVTEAQVGGKEEISEEGQRLINLASIEISKSGGLSFIDSFHYDMFYVEAVKTYEKLKYDVLIIDHSMALEDSDRSKLRSDEDRVKELSVQARKFKKRFPVNVIILSHLSSKAEEELNKFKRAKSSPTRASGVLSKEADEIFILYNTDALDKQSLVGMQIKKRRGARPPSNHIYLKFEYINVNVKYRFEDQLDSAATVKKETLINDISRVLDDDNDEDDLELDLFSED